MKSNFNQSREGLRSEVRSKRRKTNMILNGLIALVLLLIVIVSVSIFSNDDETETQKEQSVVENKQNDVQSDNKTNETDTSKQSKSTQKDTKTKDKDSKKDNKQEEESEVVTEGGGDNVQRTIVNPEWEPVGTTQSGPNSSESVDWDERVNALAYAIGADASNMTVWYLSRDGGPDKSIGTVTEKGSPKAYRVYLEWQDGWVPVKVEELIENDKVQ